MGRRQAASRVSARARARHSRTIISRIQLPMGQKTATITIPRRTGCTTSHAFIFVRRAAGALKFSDHARQTQGIAWLLHDCGSRGRSSADGGWSLNCDGVSRPVLGIEWVSCPVPGAPRTLPCDHAHQEPKQTADRDAQEGREDDFPRVHARLSDRGALKLLTLPISSRSFSSIGFRCMDFQSW